MPPKNQPPASRKRIRKRKRRNVSVSSSSPVSSGSSDESDSESFVKPNPAFKSSSPALSETSDPDSDSESSSEPETNEINTKSTTEVSSTIVPQINETTEKSVQESNSPHLKPTPGPTLVGSTNDETEKQLKKRFHEFWMATIADGFADDLDEIRKESNMSNSRLALLIDSLASGADIFRSQTGPDGNLVNEMELILGD